MARLLIHHYERTSSALHNWSERLYNLLIKDREYRFCRGAWSDTSKFRGPLRAHYRRFETNQRISLRVTLQRSIFHSARRNNASFSRIFLKTVFDSRVSSFCWSFDTSRSPTNVIRIIKPMRATFSNIPFNLSSSHHVLGLIYISYVILLGNIVSRDEKQAFAPMGGTV